MQSNYWALSYSGNTQNYAGNNLNNCLDSNNLLCIYVCMYNLFKVGKIHKDSKLYLQDIQSLIKTDDKDIK